MFPFSIVSASFRGSVGVLHLLNTEEELKFLLNDPPAPPYMAVLPPRLFTRHIVLQLKALAPEGIINGILLINNRTDLQQFSQESQCPNEFGGLDQQSCSANNETLWNPPGTDLLNEDFPFPIYFISDESEITKLVDCFNKYNNYELDRQNRRSLCSVQVKSLMSAAGNSRICMDRSKNVINLAPTRYCDALQGKNVYATLFERPVVEERKADPAEKFILVTTRTDTVSLFDEHYLGAMGSLVPFATVLAVAQFLKAVLPGDTDPPSKNILFVFFNGESLDYIGSQRFVYDLNKNLFPEAITKRNLITLDNIELMIDVGSVDDLQKIKVYTAEEFPLAAKVVASLNSESLKIQAEGVKSSVLPPFSAQTFWKENLTFPALVLTSTPSNKFYHSVFDDATNLNFTYMNRSGVDFMQLEPITAQDDSIQYKIRNFATLLGITLYNLATAKNYTDELGVNVALIDEFLYCFLISSNCTFIRAMASKADVQLPNRPPMRLVRVFFFKSVFGVKF